MIDREKVIEGVNKILSETDEYDGVLWDVLTLLKEQDAVPVIQREIMHMLFWCCGSCGVAITDGDKFCRNCGKQVKWNENT